MLDYRDILDTLQSKGYLATYYDRAFDDKFPSYFFSPNSIHGVLHAKRVLLLSLALSYLNGLNKADTGLLAKASLYHDIGRTHDGVCSEHGRKSFQKAIGLGLIDNEVNENNEVLRYVMVNHCLDDNLAETLDEYFIDDRERAVRLLKLFKDSDGLDRVRINDLDVEYLRYPVSRELVSFAEYLLREIR
ncbi:MAG: hypothetical protein ACOX86_05810 [Pelotomaculaceae bacterium]|jgi:hypothetical protein|uniref:HD domain-containing protein n=1 Tax=anaerobic digester metagenome TaxID=1263854 RepID=A0A485M0V7_9ZZZZ|nr:hypothetical protein [Bacillota bacterium]HHU86102.1 hypothetical protein [Peptococcaceae bacterium]